MQVNFELPKLCNNYTKCLVSTIRNNGNKSGKFSQHTPVLPQVATAKFKYKNQQRAITH